MLNLLFYKLIVSKVVVIPANAGIQIASTNQIDSRIRGNDTSMGKQSKLKKLRRQQETQEDQADQKANKLAGYFGLGLLALIAIIGGSIYYFFFRHTPEPTAAIDQQSSSLIENQSADNQSNQKPNITAETDDPLVNQVETDTKKPPMQYTQYPPMTIDQNKQYFATLKTSMGDIKIELFVEEAPLAVNNFVFLSREGFYNGLTFHRVIKDFMIQGGDPLGNGTGGAGYQFNDEPNDKKLIRGSLAMANSGANTNSSQFFIVTTESTPWLDGKHTNFGMVDAGMQEVMDISEVATGQGDVPVSPIIINSITIEEQ